MTNNTSILVEDSFELFVKKILNFCSTHQRERNPLEKSVEFLKQRPTGLCLEFGVYKGNSVNFIAENLPNWSIFGFDSFEGLPEKWVDVFDKGSFSVGGELPVVRDNVRLIKGLFEDTLPEWLQTHSGESLDLLHIDSDLYSSAKTILNNCRDLISVETVIVFDELINYISFEDHEIKALYEFCREMNYSVDILCFGGHHDQKVCLFVKPMD